MTLALSFITCFLLIVQSSFWPVCVTTCDRAGEVRMFTLVTLSLTVCHVFFVTRIDEGDCSEVLNVHRQCKLVFAINSNTPEPNIVASFVLK